MTCRVLDSIHSDENETLATTSIRRSFSFFTFIDDTSKQTVVCITEKKSDTFELFKKFHKFVEKYTSLKVKNINIFRRTDKNQAKVVELRTYNGDGYISNEFMSYLELNGIHLLRSVAYTSMQESFAERMRGTLLCFEQSMLQILSVDKIF